MRNLSDIQYPRPLPQSLNYQYLEVNISSAEFLEYVFHIAAPTPGPVV